MTEPSAYGITVEVAYAMPDRAIIKSYRLAAAATIEDALRQAATDPDFAALDLSGAVGIFGRTVQRGQPLAEGDRIEIYRQLTDDPKTARRARVERLRTKGR